MSVSGVVEMLVPGPQWDADQVAFGPIDPLLLLAVVVHHGVTGAVDDVQDGLRRMAMLDRRMARRQLGEVRLQSHGARQSIEARLGAPILPGDELGGPQVLDDRGFSRRVLLVPLLALGHLGDGRTAQRLGRCRFELVVSHLDSSWVTTSRTLNFVDSLANTGYKVKRIGSNPGSPGDPPSRLTPA